MRNKENIQTSKGVVLPEGWEWTTLGNVSEKPQYGWTTKANRESGQLKLLRTTDITSGTVDWSTVPYCTEEPEDVKKYLIKSGDILISRAGSVGVSFLITNPGHAVFASYLIRFRPKEGIDAKYFYYFLKSPDYWAAIGASKSGIAVPNVNASKLSSVPIPVAPSRQQKRIVAEIEKQFSRLDEAVANLKRVKANLKRYKAAVLKAAVEGKLTEQWRKEHPDIEPASKLLERILLERRKCWKGKRKYKGPSSPDIVTSSLLPETWTWVTVEALITQPLCNGISIKGSDSPPGIRALRLSAMSDVGFDYSDARYLPLSESDVDDLWIQEGDFFISRGNGSLHLVGRGTPAQLPPGPTIFPDTMIRLRFAKEIQKTGWVRSIWPSRLIHSQVERKVKTTAGIYKIAQPQVEQIVIPLPPTTEQHRIVAEVERRLSIVEELEKEVTTNLQRAERLRQSTLTSAFSGSLFE